ncbi:uncharacterized protein A1O9_11822 [Exophiala aquamarina CBS 119918]|uniref:Alcohol dehydrogenase n=1 Tax=Exophiala aquamarina CBS 119918 TaxID=1182545 RepID=A0A072P9E7_9EURO|nr:uncharacterized protein A1O9_11822 [Exophiala aquamarina CBS 119918]KEF52195.1 hypothetical protein A1O9_11822 [Exophiala aquamarina CBS 119918]
MPSSGYGQFLKGQIRTPPMPEVDLTGRTILVTGANSGLGLDAAKLLIRLNCSTIVLACRSIAKAEATQDVLRTVSSRNGKTPTLISFELEMTSFSSVASFANRCKELPRLDAAILNAGIDVLEFRLAEGYESTITVNVISTFLLATLLVPTLRTSAKKYNITPNLTITGSAVHFWTEPKLLTTPKTGQIFHSISNQQTADMKGRYFFSKLPVMLLVKYLASVLEKSAVQGHDNKPPVTLNNVAPGLCVTNLLRDFSMAEKMVVRMIGRSSEHGARTLVHGATAGPETHGQYLSECEIKDASPFVRSTEGDQTAERLWLELVDIYEKVSPGCTKEW